jgi:hypothetical protein
MKYAISTIIALVISLGSFSQVYTFNAHYVKIENGHQPEYLDSMVRTIEFKEDVIQVTNLFGCEYISEYRIVEKINDHSYIIAYEGIEVSVKYSVTDNILVVTNGMGIKGERVIHIYGEQNPSNANL